MDIRILKYFLTVAREESISKAAEVLHMTQPPLSRQLKDLEEEIGKQLLIRGNKRIKLTEDGILLKKRAEEIIELMEKTKTELSSSDAMMNGNIYFGSAETEVISIIADIAKQLQEKYPLIRYNLYSGDANHITEKLDKGLIDFGLLIEPVDIDKYNHIELPIKDRWGVLMQKNKPLAQKKAIEAEDLLKLPVIVSHQTLISKTIRSWLNYDISKLNIIATYDLVNNASRFAKAGLGYIIALDKIINTTDSSELCFRPLSPKLEASLYIVWKKNQIFSKAAELFLKRIQSELTKTS